MEFFYFFMLTLFLSRRWAAASLICTPEFCDEYVQKNPCPPLDPACSNPNISIVLPSPTPCNCCEQCFLFQEIGGDCAVGRPGQALPNIICKPGTECIDGICKKKTTPDPDFYPGYECENGVCTCTVIEKDGVKKIFGTFKEAADLKKEKQCGCSISAYLARKFMNRVLPFPDLYLPIPRCMANGQFDPLQCVDDMCGCVDGTTGVWDSAVRKVPVTALRPNNPKCFDREIHKMGEYYTDCERERNSLMSDKLWGDVEGTEIIFSHKVECTPDGKPALSARVAGLKKVQRLSNMDSLPRFMSDCPERQTVL